MAQATKTFKIGEWAKGGVITIEVTGKVVVIIGKEWDFSAGSKKSSDQSKAKEFIRATIDTTQSNAYYKTMEFLEDLTTSYYAGQVMQWIQSKVPSLLSTWS